jgi:hypothetical protein
VYAEAALSTLKVLAVTSLRSPEFFGLIKVLSQFYFKEQISGAIND